MKISENLKRWAKKNSEPRHFTDADTKTDQSTWKPKKPRGYKNNKDWFDNQEKKHQKEEVEISEISKRLKWSYAMGANPEAAKLRDKEQDHMRGKGASLDKDEKRKLRNRSNGLNNVAHHLTGIPNDGPKGLKRYAKEGVELSELSKRVLSNYANKAFDSFSDKDKKADKRDKGIELAYNKTDPYGRAKVKGSD